MDFLLYPVISDKSIAIDRKFMESTKRFTNERK